MKKFLTMVLIAGLIASFAACGQSSAGENTASKQNQKETQQFTGDIKVTVNSLEELNTKVENDVDESLTTLEEEWTNFKSRIDSYEKYKSNIDDVEAFYAKVLEDTHQLCMRMYLYSLEYARFIMDSDRSFGEKYDDFDELYDTVYDDAGEDIFDAVYDGILSEMFKAFYDGILSDAYEDVPYGEWSEALSDEYDRWSDTNSDVYDEWSDMRSDIYDFCSDMHKEMWDKDQERAEKKYNDFLEDVQMLLSKKKS